MVPQNYTKGEKVKITRKVQEYLKLLKLKRKVWFTQYPFLFGMELSEENHSEGTKKFVDGAMGNNSFLRYQQSWTYQKKNRKKEKKKRKKVRELKTLD